MLKLRVGDDDPLGSNVLARRTRPQILLITHESTYKGMVASGDRPHLDDRMRLVVAEGKGRAVCHLLQFGGID